MVTVVDEQEIRARLPWPELVRALGQGFADPAGVTVPLRHHHAMDPGADDGPTLLLMPAWSRAYAGVKIVGVFPANAARRLPTVTGSYLLIGGDDGRPLALLDGAELTARRTAAASVLAATHLARPESETLLLVGSGRIAAAAAEAYAAHFPLARTLVWNHRPTGAEALARRLRDNGGRAHALTDLAEACAEADIITCATLSNRALVEGRWLQPGTHVDLIGAFTPAMREADDECLGRATVFVDSREGALAEGGDLVQAVASGALDPSDIAGDLFELCAGAVPGRTDAEQLTLFKSVGHALEDLVAAVAVHEGSSPT